MKTIWVALALVPLTACSGNSSESGSPAAGADSGAAPDTGAPRDAATLDDASVRDAGAPPLDGGIDAAASVDATFDAGTANDAEVEASADAATDAGNDARVADAAPPTAAATPAELTATTATMTGDGIDNCGPNGDDVCARSLLVPGGTFLRGTGTRAPATVSTFRLDKYEVTVGRFRRFFEAWIGGWRPSVGAGKHAHVNGGQGLAATTGGYESGWTATWSTNVGRPKSNTVNPPTNGTFDAASWNQAFSGCASQLGGWTPTAGTFERNPMNCLSWYDLHAFCIWDGGFVPTDAEWEYAAAGGSEERTYPWGDTLLSPGYAVADRTFAEAVGGAWRGAGRWGHLDLAGNVREWTLDQYELDFASPCTDCLALPAGNYRVYRSPPYDAPLNGMQSTERSAYWAASRLRNIGGRCARRP